MPPAGGVAAQSAADGAPAIGPNVGPNGGGVWYQVVAGPSLVAATPQVARNAIRPLARGDQKET